ncbi:MAG: hypothetical protein AAGD06_10770 [Acidobacteriota bacterium]
MPSNRTPDPLSGFDLERDLPVTEADIAAQRRPAPVPDPDILFHLDRLRADLLPFPPAPRTSTAEGREPFELFGPGDGPGPGDGEGRPTDGAPATDPQGELDQ